MNINDAIQAFEASRAKKYTSVDRATIVAAAEELNLTEFTVASDFITDVGNSLHVHPTMIVAAHPFRDSADRGPDPYPKHRHFLELGSWIDTAKPTSKTAASLTALCPVAHMHVPPNRACDYCGEVHSG